MRAVGSNTADCMASLSRWVSVFKRTGAARSVQRSPLTARAGRAKKRQQLDASFLVVPLVAGEDRRGLDGAFKVTRLDGEVGGVGKEHVAG